MCISVGMSVMDIGGCEGAGTIKKRERRGEEQKGVKVFIREERKEDVDEEQRIRKDRRKEERPCEEWRK